MTQYKDKVEQQAPATPTMEKCVDTRKRGENKWIKAGRDNYTEAEARKLCKDYTYMSLECPKDNGFEVWCANNISNMPVLANKECTGNPSDTSINNGENGGCSGIGGVYLTDDGLNMGGFSRGSLYKI